MQTELRTPEPTMGVSMHSTSCEQIVAALGKVSALDGLTTQELKWLAEHGIERCANAGDVLFREGQPAVVMGILLRGEIHIRREFGGNMPLLVGKAGQVTGRLPFSRMVTYGAFGYAASDLWMLTIDQSLFDEMLHAIPSMTQRSVSILLDRVREMTRIQLQSEKLSALGKLAANLAHELNNPASAAQRSASGLLTELRTYGSSKYELGALCLDRPKLDAARAWQQEMRDRGSRSAAQAAVSEDALNSWFQRHGYGEDTWRMTPELSECGVTPADLDRLHRELGMESSGVLLRQFASTLRAERMTTAMLDATARIFELIAAVKDYSYMDQAPIQEVDVPQGIENTLAMLQSRLRDVVVERRYGQNLPTISAYGSELNQVWMALLENAIDSIEASGRPGHITIGVTLAGPQLLVEIWDNGQGIPEELRDRIFEPFFSTRAPGSGLGLGLDTAQRIVGKHRGYIRVQSTPEATCFQVRLPVEQLQAY